MNGKMCLFITTECSGKGLKPVIHCNFEEDFCGFTQSGFEWIRTKGKQVTSKRPEIPFDGYPPGSHFVYSNSSYSTEVYGKGTISIYKQCFLFQEYYFIQYYFL